MVAVPEDGLVGLLTEIIGWETYKAVFGDGDHFEAIRNALR